MEEYITAQLEIMIWKYVHFRLPELIIFEHLIPVVKFAK